jgi:hypothetical protein
MPTAQLTYEVRQTIPSSGSYTVVFEVLDAVNIPREIFTHDSGTQAFTGVSTVYDINTWPVVLDPDLMSYRSLLVTRTYSTMAAAENFIAVTKGRIESLRVEWQGYLDTFAASEVVTIPEN